MLISLIAGVIHSAIGFGFGIVAITFLPLIIDAKTSHIILSVSSVPMLVVAAWTYRHGAQRPPLFIAIVGACISTPLGLFFFEALSLDLLVRLTGAGVLLMVIPSLREKAEAPKKDQVKPFAKCFAAGLISGFLAGAVSIAGPPIAAFAIRQNWRTDQYKAFVTQFLLVIAIFKAVLLGLRNHINTEIGLEILATSVFSMIGVILGERISRKIEAEKSKKLVAFALLSIALIMLLQGSAT